MLLCSDCVFDMRCAGGCCHLHANIRPARPQLLVRSLLVAALSHVLLCLFSEWQWEFKADLYWIKVLYGILSFPFAVFVLPLLSQVLLHVRPTAYNQGQQTPSTNVPHLVAFVCSGGETVPLMPPRDVEKRYEEEAKAKQAANAPSPVVAKPVDSHDIEMGKGSAPPAADEADRESVPVVDPQRGSKLSCLRSRFVFVVCCNLLFRPFANANSRGHGRGRRVRLTLARSAAMHVRLCRLRLKLAV